MHKNRIQLSYKPIFNPLLPSGSYVTRSAKILILI